MPVEIFLYDLLDFGGNIELTEPMTEEEARKANEDLLYKEPRFLRWVKSNNQKYLLVGQDEKTR